MKWVDHCIRNKFMIYMLAGMLCILGIFCIGLMDIAPFPSIQMSNISIRLSYPGANADTVERQVTSKIVRDLQSINNIQQITANSQPGSSDIELTLNSLSDLQLIQTQLQIIQAIQSSNLPIVVPQPQVEIQQGTSEIADLVITSDTRSLFDLQNFILGVLVPELQSLPNTFLNTPEIDPVVKIKLDPARMAAYKLDPSVVSQTINNLYQSNPLGSMAIQDQLYILNNQNNLNTLDQLGNLMIGYEYAQSPNALNSSSSNNSNQLNTQNIYLGQPVYLKNIATLSFEPRKLIADNIYKLEDQNALEVFIGTHTNADPFSSSASIQNLIKRLPADIHVTSFSGAAKMMKTAITEVVSTILISSVLVLLITLIFLGRLKATLIPIATIPVCLLGSVIFLYLFGFSLNLISLLAMVIAVGLVVDDAIVVIENISRYLEQGHKKHQAVLEGTHTISPIIIGITLTLVVAYLPILFSSNPVADMFKPFALTLGGAVLISGIMALTLTPVMSNLLLSDQPLNPYQIKFDHTLNLIIRKYHWALSKILKFKKTSLLIALILISAGVYQTSKLPEMIFPDDPSHSVRVSIVGSPQESMSSLEKRLAIFKSFEQDPRIKTYEIVVQKDPISGVLEGHLTLTLQDQYLTQTSHFVQSINQFIQTKNLQDTFAKSQNVSSWWDGYDLSFYIYGAGNLNQLSKISDQITQALKNLNPNSNQFSFVSAQINPAQKQLNFDINQAKAASLGISDLAIQQLLSTYYGGYTLNNYFNIANLSVPIVIQLDTPSLTNPASLQTLMIQSPLTQKFYALNNFVNLSLVANPLVITTLNGQEAIEINANLNKNYSLSTAIPLINQIMKDQFPSVQFQYTGNALSYLQSNNQTLLIALMGILSVFFLLAIIFKNLIDPFIIMLTVPFAMIGGALSLYLIGGSINLYSSLGLITLVGLITKHGVLIVQFANQNLKQGMSVIDAVLHATDIRFRPIIMTTLAMTFGALPLILSSEIFYKSRENLGITIMGGVLIGTVFSLFVIPLVYVLLKRAPRIHGS